MLSSLKILTMAYQHAEIGWPAGDSYIEVNRASVEVNAGQSDAVHIPDGQSDAVPTERVGHGCNAQNGRGPKELCAQSRKASSDSFA